MMIQSISRRFDVDVRQPTKPYTKGINGEDKISSFTPTTPFHTFGATKNTDGKYYFGVMGRADKNRDPYIFKYNPDTNEIEQERRLQIGVVPFDDDTHRIPNIAHDESGHIYLVFEKLHATNGHGSEILFYKTTVPYDLTTLTLKQTLTGRWSYPFIAVSGSNVFICARGSTNTSSFIRGQQWYYNSTDGGETFGSAVQLYGSGNEQKVSYCWMQYDHSGGIYVVLNERDNDLSNWTFVAMVKGAFNSNIWTDVAGGNSKNVSSSGAITRTEMLTNYLVMQSSNTSTIAVNHEGGIVKSAGSIKLVVSVQTLTGNTLFGNPESELTDLRFYYYSGGSWLYNSIDIPSGMVFYWAYKRLFNYLNSDEAFDDVIFIDSLNNSGVYIKRSSDNFSTESETLKLAGNGYYRLGAFCGAIDSEDDYFIVCVSTESPADPHEITNEGPEDYSNLVILRP